MAYAQIARGLGQVLGKGFLRNLGGKKAVKEIAQESLLSGGLNFGLGIGGQVMANQPIDVGQALLYAGADTLASGASLAGVRGSRPRRMRKVQVTDPKTGQKIMQTERVRSKLETPVNILASIGSSIPVGMLAGQGNGNALQGQGTTLIQNPQTVQVAQQNAQRALVNMDPNLIAGAYMPGTMMQNTNAPSSSAMYQQFLNDAGRGVGNDATFHANSMAIMGL
jgi:hypothetical protein